MSEQSSVLRLFVVNIALGGPLSIGLLYQKSYLITQHIQQQLFIIDKLKRIIIFFIYAKNNKNCRPWLSTSCNLNGKLSTTGLRR
jgi:hypothetical protein